MTTIPPTRTQPAAAVDDHANGRHRAPSTATATATQATTALRHRAPRCLALVLLAASIAFGVAGAPITPVPDGADLQLREADVTYDATLDLLVFRMQVAGTAGGTVPQPRGQLDGAPVLGYVFPTTLAPSDVGFGGVEGIVALAVTSHPDFDDTPLWDEGNTGRYDDDGAIFHSHWVVLVGDDRVAGGLAVAHVHEGAHDAVLPPTNPGMPMFMDSPGFSVVLAADELRVLVPAQRVNHRTDFAFDAVVAYMQVDTGEDALPMLGVYTVYDVLSGDLSLPFTVTHR